MHKNIFKWALSYVSKELNVNVLPYINIITTKNIADVLYVQKHCATPNMQTVASNTITIKKHQGSTDQWVIPGLGHQSSFDVKK